MTMSGRSSPHSPTYEDFMRYPEGVNSPYQTSPLSECTNSPESPVSKKGLIGKGISGKMWRRGMIGVFCLCGLIVGITVILVKLIGKGSPQYDKTINAAFASNLSSTTYAAQTGQQISSATAFSTSIHSAAGIPSSLRPSTTSPPALTTISNETSGSSAQSSAMVMLTTMLMTMPVDDMNMSTSASMDKDFIGVVIGRTDATTPEDHVSTNIMPVITLTEGTRTITRASVAVSTVISSCLSNMETFMSSITTTQLVSSDVPGTVSPSTSTSGTTLNSIVLSTSTSTSPISFCSSLTSGDRVACPDLGAANRLFNLDHIAVCTAVVVFVYMALFT